MMSELRKNNINKAALEQAKLYANTRHRFGDIYLGFIDGAAWADEHVNSIYKLKEPDFIKKAAEEILYACDHTTTGNVSHSVGLIKGYANDILKSIEKI